MEKEFKEPKWKTTCRCCGKTLEGYDYKPSYSEWARTDAYGIYTGVFCDKCYDSDKYPYRKDEYFDPAFAGENLNEDY